MHSPERKMKELVKLEGLTRMNILTNRRLYHYDNIASKYDEILKLIQIEKNKLQSQMPI